MADPIIADDMITSSSREESQEAVQQDEHQDDFREGESEESRSSSDGDGQRTGSDDEQKQRRRRRQRRVKGGKRHHRKYRPYRIPGQTDNEQTDKDASVTAHLRRASLLASGHPLAPYNTTQYLIEDRRDGQLVPASPQSPLVQQIASRPMTPNHAPSATPRHPGIVEEDASLPPPNCDLYPSGNATPSDSNNYDEEFVENYERSLNDRFLTMTRNELLQTALGLQQRCENMKQRLIEDRIRWGLPARPVSAPADLDGEISDFSSDEDAGIADVTGDDITIDIGVDFDVNGNTGTLESTATTA